MGFSFPLMRCCSHCHRRQLHLIRIYVQTLPISPKKSHADVKGATISHPPSKGRWVQRCRWSTVKVDARWVHRWPLTTNFEWRKWENEPPKLIHEQWIMENHSECVSLGKISLPLTRWPGHFPSFSGPLQAKSIDKWNHKSLWTARVSHLGPPGSKGGTFDLWVGSSLTLHQMSIILCVVIFLFKDSLRLGRMKLMPQS